MQPPRAESRLSALEALTSLHTASIRELASDTAEGLRDLKQDIKQLSEKVDLGFRQAHAYIDENMATKEDVAALKAEHNQRFDKLEATQNELKATQNEHSAMLRQILGLLQQKGE